MAIGPRGVGARTVQNRKRWVGNGPGVDLYDLGISEILGFGDFGNLDLEEETVMVGLHLWRADHRRRVPQEL